MYAPDLTIGMNRKLKFGSTNILLLKKSKYSNSKFSNFRTEIRRRMYLCMYANSNFEKFQPQSQNLRQISWLGLPTAAVEIFQLHKVLFRILPVRHFVQIYII